jgi:hypothetical protein
MPQTIVDTLVRITVRPSTKPGEYTLSYSPMRWHESVIYFTPPGKPENPILPREVRWEVSGLPADHWIEISEKHEDNHGRNRMKGDTIKIYAGNPVGSSGPAQFCRPPRPHAESWTYQIVLKNPNRTLHTIDPDIIIKEDP